MTRPPSPDPKTLLGLYGAMLTIRLAEERLQALFADGEVPGFIHLSIGQEAVPVGIAAALKPDDTVASNHRGHGHALAKGVDLDGLFAELMGRDNGLCRGRGGSMHVADLTVGMLGANGIVGAGLPITLGSALAHQVKDNGAVAVAFFGDGALAEGVLHECLNLAALWKLPMLFVCENNGWSEFSPTERQMKAEIKALAKAFSISQQQVDGNDVVAVAAAARTAVAAARSGKGPRVVECITTRVRGHFEGDRQDYRANEELAGLKTNDPIERCRVRLRNLGVEIERLIAVETEIRERVERAVVGARAAPDPDFAKALAEVYTLPTSPQSSAASSAEAL